MVSGFNYSNFSSESPISYSIMETKGKRESMYGNVLSKQYARSMKQGQAR